MMVEVLSEGERNGEKEVSSVMTIHLRVFLILTWVMLLLPRLPAGHAHKCI